MIGPEKQQALAVKLKALGVDRRDVVEKFVRGGGPGGQHVNKVATAVHLRHLPTGLEVKMGQERSQALNRFLAWRLLAEKIEARLLGIRSARRRAIEKIRRQKRKRSKRAREKMLQDKKHVGAKKIMRRSPVDAD
ncbi:MAG: peptide chain release factor-like protein [Candidatus Margulisbacteria bacterium]|jgi:protein subunit release factor B|nr:peptide chain release factor-like protein [Candidatus Margulisiibacteriota bacterium]